MQFSIITLFPEVIKCFVEHSIIKKAQEKDIIKIKTINPREFATDKHKTVDDNPYGGGAGMVLKVDIAYKAINFARQTSESSSKTKVILTTPKGQIFNQKKAQEYAKLNHLIIFCGHYEGVDERVLSFVDEEVSLGDFILTGGEIPAVAILETTARLIPGVLGKEESSKEETFSEYPISELERILGEHPLLEKLKKKGVKKVPLLEYPQYTRPEEFLGLRVPEILLSGNHQKIREWRLKKAFEETLKKRPDLFEKILNSKN